MRRCAGSIHATACTSTSRASTSFEPWLGRVEQRVGKAQLGEIADEIPPEWYNDEYEVLGAMLNRLVSAPGARPGTGFSRPVIRAASHFPNWK